MIASMACKDIDDKAGEVRSCFITVSPGQESVYLLKQQEADRFLNSTDPDPRSFPMLAAEAAATGKDIPTLASEVVHTARQWSVLAGMIEAARIEAKAKIKSARSIEELAAARGEGLDKLEAIKRGATE